MAFVSKFQITAAALARAAKKPNSSRLLMAFPRHFKLAYSINPWMSMQKQVNHQRMIDQWETLKQSIQSTGAIVEVMDPKTADNYPDLVFTANAAVVRGRQAYLANFFYPERQGERYFYDEWFSNNGFNTTGDQDVPFEGAGDALWIGDNDDKLICGVGPRTDVRALQRLAFHLKDEHPFKVIGCRLIDPRFYHIDTCFCPLGSNMAMWYPRAFEPVTQHNLKNEIELIDVPEQEACQFACNSVIIGDTVIMPIGNPQTKEMLIKLGFNVLTVDMSEFMKSGGASKCCVLQI